MAVTYSPEIATEICQRLAAGEGLATICRDAHLPCESSVRLWADKDHDGFAARFARARELQAEHWASQIVEIADGVAHNATSEQVQAARLQVDSRKWIASKVLPKQYGDRMEHVGAGGKDLIPPHARESDGLSLALMLAIKSLPKPPDEQG